MSQDINQDSEIVTFTSTTQSPQLILPDIPIGTTLTVSSTIPFDIVCNGFSLKETIIDVLKKYEDVTLNENQVINEIAEEIKLELAHKLRIKERIK